MKTKWKALLAVCLSALLLMVCAAAADGPTITVESVTGVVGDTMKVSLSMEGFPDVMGLELAVSYDSSALEYVSGQATGPLGSAGGFLQVNTASPKITWVSDSLKAVNGKIAELTFKVKEGASIGAKTMTVSGYVAKSDNKETDSVAYTATPGTITIQAAPHDHDWGTGAVTTPATCSRKGVRTFTCSICGETKTEDIPTLPHTPETRNAVAPTCTTPGKEADTVCAICNTVIETGAALPATGHDWDEGTVTTAPTCTDDGEKKMECMTCGAEKTEVVPATGHSWDTGNITTAPTCTDDGQADYTCTVCGDSETRPLKATGHSWKQDKVLTEASCDKPGEVHLVCETCGEEKTEAIPASGHSWDAGQQTVAPTVGKAGEKTYTCAICGAKRTEAIPALSPEPTKPAETPAASTVSPNTNSGVTLLWMLLLLLGGGSVAAATYRKKLRG